MTAPSKAPEVYRAGIGAGRSTRPRKYPVSDGAPLEIVEDGPSLAGRLLALGALMTIKPTLTIGSYAPHMPWPWSVVDFASRVLRPPTGTIRATIGLTNCTAQLVRAPGVLPADGTRRIVLYMHGGAFLTCGANSHGRMVTELSNRADAPVLLVNYRMIPKNSVGEAVDDCMDAYRWLRLKGYEPEQIVLAGDSAGGYLSLAVAERLQLDGETPAAIVAMSPLFELAKEPKQAHPNIKTDVMFGAKAFEALADLVARAASRRLVNGVAEEVYEPLDHIEPGLPRTMIHVSGSEVLLHDARLAARRLAAAGVPVELHIWPGQMHVFQIGGTPVPEAQRSLRQMGDYIREATG